MAGVILNFVLYYVIIELYNIRLECLIVPTIQISFQSKTCIFENKNYKEN